MKTRVPIRALIVEDEPLARQTIRDFVADEKWLEIIGEAPDGNAAINLINQLRPDLVFLDVRMPGLNGIRVLESINHAPQIVFTTAYDDLAVTAFELEALDYILKPFGRERFKKSLMRVQRRLLEAEPTADPSAPERALHAFEAKPTEHLSRLFVRDSRGRIVHLRVEEISRLAGADDYTEIYANNTSYLVRLTLNQFEERLDPESFRRIHRSTIVNLDHLRSLTQVNRRLVLKLRDGSEVTASRAGSQKLRDLLV